MDKNITVLSIYHIDAAAIERLEKFSSGIRVIHTPTLKDMESRIADADVILSLNFSDALLKKAEKLRWFQAVGAGVNHLLTEDFVKSGVKLTNSRGNHAIPVSEHAFALLLALTRRIYRCYEENSILDRWDRIAGDELCGKTIGILGVGNIGREIARKARAFGMKVRGFDEVPVYIPYLDEQYLGDQVYEFFSGLDVLVAAAALTKTNHGIINKKHMSLMNEGSYIVNIARGPLIVEQDLVAALEHGPLAGAGLDVFNEEPLPKDNILRSLPNVVLTPHIGGFNPNYSDRVIKLFVENFRRWIQKEPFINSVDPSDVVLHNEGRN
jgi:phosphoglycerate dehydrogenase-like enzyme